MYTAKLSGCDVLNNSYEYIYRPQMSELTPIIFTFVKPVNQRYTNYNDISTVLAIPHVHILSYTIPHVHILSYNYYIYNFVHLTLVYTLNSCSITVRCELGWLT